METRNKTAFLSQISQICIMCNELTYLNSLYKPSEVVLSISYTELSPPSLWVKLVEDMYFSLLV